MASAVVSSAKSVAVGSGEVGRSAVQVLPLGAPAFTAVSTFARKCLLCK
jgi:hypothetical protein